MIPKFRLFDKRFRLMLEVHVIDFYERTIDCYADDLGVNRQEVYSYEMDEDDYVLMQYTGLHDKNGKEIFEGDIVQEFDDKYEVKYDIERAGWQPFATDDGCGCCSWELASVEYSEVFGNVHENSDLIKEEN